MRASQPDLITLAAVGTTVGPRRAETLPAPEPLFTVPATTIPILGENHASSCAATAASAAS